ncbi:MAG: hypothetical protein C4522_09300 [Desulfobacteraceae bacterium]|nr:MAG: hypothetical protein C4522_09300 [Desulfobacteraceae bacterium]
MKTAEALLLLRGDIELEILARNEYLAAENEILKTKLDKPVRLTDPERIRLAQIGKRIGLKALKSIACIVKPETILKWFRELVAGKFDGSKNRNYPGRPGTKIEIEKLILELVQNNPDWGYDRIAGTLSNLGFDISDQTVGNILRKNGISPAPKRRPEISWHDFIKSHENVLTACDFFTTEVITKAGLITYYVLFFIHIGSRKIHIAGVTSNPDEKWMKQIVRNVSMADLGFLSGCRYLIHDRDSKFCHSFQKILQSVGIKPIRLPPRSPNLNAFAERWVRSVKEECLSKLVLFGRQGLENALREYVAHYHEERNHQGLENRIPFPSDTYQPDRITGEIVCNSRLNGLLKYYYRSKNTETDGNLTGFPLQHADLAA